MWYVSICLSAHKPAPHSNSLLFIHLPIHPQHAAVAPHSNRRSSHPPIHPSTHFSHQTTALWRRSPRLPGPPFRLNGSSDRVRCPAQKPGHRIHRPKVRFSTHPLTHLPIHLPIHPITHSSHPFIQSFALSPNLLPTQSPTHPPTHPPQTNTAKTSTCITPPPCPSEVESRCEWWAPRPRWVGEKGLCRQEKQRERFFVCV